jgi:hypothetical protein
MKCGKKSGSPKTGGRKKGSMNKVNRAAELRKAAEASGQTPLEFMLATMRDEKVAMEIRCDMAKAAAPYVHARRAPEDKVGNTVPPMIYVHPDLEEPE